MTNKDFRVQLPDGRIHTLYSPFPKQQAFHESNVANLLAIGSRGSGKSILLRNDAHMRALSVPNSNLILIRKTFPDLMKNHIIHLDEEMKLLGGYYHKQHHIAHYPNGSRLFLSHVSTGDQAMNLLGAEFLAAYIDEISVIPWDFFMKLTASVRVPIGSSGKAVVRAATNPLGESTEQLRKYFIDKNLDESDPLFQDYIPEDWGYIRINMEDNPYIDSVQYRKRLGNLTGALRKAWLDGEFSEDDRLFEFNQERDGREWHVVNNLDLKKLIRASQVYRAFDWGWSPDPSYCAWIAHLGNRFIVFNEKLWNKTNVPEIAAEIKEIDAMLGVERVVTTFCDPSMDVHHGHVQTTKDLFESNGIPMECSVNDREYFARAMHQALGTTVSAGVPKLQVYKPRCPELIRAIPQMRFDPKRPLRMDDHPNDHPVVTVAYFLISHGSLDRPEPVARRERPMWQRKKSSDRHILGAHNVSSRKGLD